MKRQWIKESDGSVYLSVAMTALRLLEDSENLDLRQVAISAKLADPAWVLANVRQRRRVELEVSGLGTAELGETISDVEVVLKRGAGADASLLDLYLAIPVNVVRLDFVNLRPLAAETSATGLEFMGIYTGDGKLAVLEGETFRVRAPFVRALAALHTHPSWGCGLSRKDVESGLELLTEGGLFTGAVTEDCAFLMIRRGLVTEEDFINVKSNKLEGLETIKFVKVSLPG